MQNDKKLSKKALAESVEQLANQFTDLNRRLNSVSYQKVNQDAQLNELDKENTLLRQQLQELQGHFNQLTADEASQAEQWQRLRDQLASVEARTGSQAEEQVPGANLERLEVEIASLQTEQQDHDTMLAEVRKYLNRLSSEIDNMRRETADITAHIRNLEENESELEVHDSEYEAQVYDLQGNLAELELKLERKLSQAEKPSNQSPRQLPEINALLPQKIEQLEDQQTQYKSLYKELERRLLELSNRIGETNAKTQHAETRADNQQERVARLQQALEERIGELESVILALKALSDQAEDKQAIEQLKLRLGQIEQQIPRLEETTRELQSSKLPKADIILLNERISGSESQLVQQRNEIGGVSRQLDELTGKLTEQGQEVDRIDGLTEQLKTLQHDSEEIRAHSGALEQQLNDSREHAAAEQDSLNHRLSALMGEIEDNKDARQQTKQQLTELESHLQERLQVLDGLQAEQQRLLETRTEEQQDRFVLLEQGMQTLEKDQTGLQSGQQQLTSNQTQQAEALQGMVAEAAEHQAETERLKLDLTQLHGQVEKIRSIDWRQTLAIAGAFLFVLLAGIGVHQLLQKQLDETEHSLVQKINRQGESYVGRQELEARLQAEVDSAAVGVEAIDPALLKGLQQTQQQLASRLTDVEERLIANATVNPASSAQGPNLEQRLGMVEGQGQAALARQQELAATIKQLQLAMTELRQDLQSRTLPASVQHWRDWAAAGSYSIQLIGVSDQASLLAYAAQIGLDGERAILHTQREGTDWYVLLYGLYPTATDATQALNALPESLRRHQPWIRLLPKQGEYTPF